MSKRLTVLAFALLFLTASLAVVGCTMANGDVESSANDYYADSTATVDLASGESATGYAVEDAASEENGGSGGDDGLVAGIIFLIIIFIVLAGLFYFFEIWRNKKK